MAVKTERETVYYENYVDNIKLHILYCIKYRDICVICKSDSHNCNIFFHFFGAKQQLLIYDIKIVLQYNVKI